MRTWTRSLVAVVAVSVFSCGDNAEGPPDSAPKATCHDSKDNDGDGLVDFPDDPGCHSLDSDTEEAPVKPKCSDNRDNDRDGLKDYPNDPGCVAPEADDEVDDCPNGAFCPQCANGVDDDGSGRADYPVDVLGCDSAADNFEYAGSLQACGPNLKLKQLPTSGMDFGILDSMSVTNITNPCNSGGNGAPAIGYVMVLNKPKVVVISTEGSAIDTVLDLRKAPCMDAGSEIACNDNIASGNLASKITRSLNAGVYYIIVQARNVGLSGPYTIKVEKFKGEGETCTVQGDCGPGLVCRIPVNGTQQICTKPVCSDGLDDDMDGDIDHPNDPGCVTPDDADESDDCPAGPNCPDCADGVDNDGDTNVDFPMDTSCKAASDSSEACTTSEAIVVITTTSTPGDTTNAINDTTPSCGSGSKELLYRLDLPAMQTLTLNVTGLDTIHSLLNASCGGTPIACQDPQNMTVNTLAAGTYYVQVEGWLSSVQGPFNLLTGGTIAPGGSCEGTLFTNGVISCPSGFTCDGLPGAKKCTTQCSDGLDNNGDGKTDYPADPGCSAPGDNMEDTVCPGTMCPVCSDTIDNDMDGQIDWPLDTSCPAASGSSESCATSEAIGQITTAVTSGTTVGAINDFDPTCNLSGALAPDVIYKIDLPAMQSLTLTVSGFDTAHSLLNSACTSTIQCSDPPTMLQGPLAAGSYFVTIEGWNTTTGPFTLTTSGQIAAGGSCEGQLAMAGVISCQSGFVCDGPVGARTCRTQCTDGIDNNGNGVFDYPNDPGCSAPNDNNENTVCPGVTCPLCADGIDNDGDGNIDYPMDPQCQAAGGSSESCITSEAILTITGTTSSGTTTGLTNDYKPICGFQSSHTAPDVMYQLDVPQMQTLTLNLSGFDGAHSLVDSLCSPTPIGCSDPNLLTINGLAAGRYYVIVDGWSSGQGAYTLTTGGTIAVGGSCETPLFPGTFSCATGTTCQGPVGARRCVSACSDGMDNNADGKIDFPNDPGCDSLADTTESSVCPGVSCPVCSNTVDDDGDALADFPADFGCRAANGTTEVFCAIEPNFAGVISTMTTNGTLAAPAVGNYSQSCQTNTGNDVAYALSLPVAVTQLRIDTFGSTIPDTVLSIKDAQCGVQLSQCAPTLACCNDDVTLGNGLSLLTVNNVQPGNYAIQVDSYLAGNNNHGPFKLNVRGTVGAGAACTSPLFASGVLACPTGTTCMAGTCQ